MLTTKDYLKAEPLDAVVARVNDEYNVEIQSSSVRVSALESQGGTRTRIVLTPNQSTSEFNTSPPIERTEFFYDRLDLASFFKATGVKDLGGLKLPATTFDVLNAIGELNDIKFTLNDFVHKQFDQYGQEYVLEANPKSLRFVGSIRFKLVNTTKQLLQNLGNVVELPFANTWPIGTDGTKLIGQYQTSGYDFTEEREFLKALSKDSVWPSGRKVAQILERITGRAWVCSTTAADWNVAFEAINGEARLKVFYNGRVLPRYTPRTDFQNVLILQLGSLSNNVNGYLLIHYN